MQAKTILLVEDNANDAALARAAFARSSTPHRLVVAEDGVDAIEYLLGGRPGDGDPAVMPEVVLLDLKLPGIDGFDVLQQLRATEETRALPVVVFTSSVEAQDVERSYRLGANSYLRKPVDFDELISVAHQIAAYWLDLNQPQPPRVAP